jgi:hypothetical protein
MEEVYGLGVLASYVYPVYNDLYDAISALVCSEV